MTEIPGTDKIGGFEPSAIGIMHCLRVLAAEAESLRLRNTLAAISHAVRTAACEIGAVTDRDVPAVATMPPLSVH